MLTSPLAVPAAAVDHGIAAGLLEVTQIHGIDENTNVQVSVRYPVNNFQLVSANRADYTVRVGVGPAASEDEILGVMMTSVSQNGRDNFGSNAYPVSAIATNGSGTYRLVTWLGDSGIEYNANVAGAWFPYDRYLGGFARNSAGANGATNNLFTGSPGLVLGTHFESVAAGKSMVDLRSFGIDARTSGILLVTHAKDEDNFALSQVNTANGTWNLFIRDSGEPSYSNYEQDPVAFVFIPKTNTSVVSGRFNGDASIALFSGSSPQFSVTSLGTGRWELRINGHSPTNGILIISPEGGGNLNGDNIVSYQINAAQTGWEIQSRDTPNNGLQTPVGASGEPEAVASFVYIPAPTPGFTVTPTNGLTTPVGGTATFTVALHAQPAANVSINLGSSNPAKGLASPATLTFTPNNWIIPQTVTITGQNDPAAGGSVPYIIVLGLATSADPRYQGLNPSDVSVTHVPLQVTQLAPADSAGNVSNSPNLSAIVTNAVPGNLTVTFYGREAPVGFPGPDFTIVVLPDTQMYTGQLSGGKKEMMIAQTEWAISNRISRNVAYVTQLGDISNNGDNPSYISQWLNATNAMYRLENQTRTQLPDGIAYGVAVGNHEQTPNGNPDGTTTNYNRYFGVPHFSGRAYYAGHYGTNNDNHFDFFSASGLDFVVIYFEYDVSANPEVLAWANEVLRTNANRRAILVTHYFGSATTPSTFSAQGAAIYHALKPNTNIFMMLSGHVTGQGSRQDTFNGNTIRTFVADYQGWTNGGNGFMRLMEFSPSNNTVVVQTYSPWTGEYKTDEASEFWFDYNMQPLGTGSAGTPWTNVWTQTGVSPGSTINCPWAGLQLNKAYEWKVIATDSAGNVAASPVWRFTTTTTNTPPVLTNRSLVVTGDAATTINLIATDINQDALTYHLSTFPNSGVLLSFEATNGTTTYLPARGYRGTDRFTYRAFDGLAHSAAATMNLTVVSPADTNANGLPDAWEAAYGITDPNADDDGDGQSNSAEYFANTNPTNAASVLAITGMVCQTNGHVQLTWPSVGGTRYRVQFNNNRPPLGLQGVFNDIPRPLTVEMNTNAPDTSGTQMFVDDQTLTGPATNNARYYRIKVQR